MNSSPRLTVIIVNYKTARLVLDCIASLFLFDTAGIEIIVVDNFSGDNSEVLLKEKYPSILYIAMNYNAGFARANNAGIAKAKGDVVLLLNADTIVLNNAVGNSLNKLLHSDYVACGVQLLNEDGSPQISGNYAMTGGLNYLLPLPFIGNVLKKLGTFFKVTKPNVPDAAAVVEVDWINGAFLMVKQSAIQQAGVLDEDFFLYAEEAEWCSRLKKTGKLCIFGNEKVLHLQGMSANEAFASTGKGYYNLSDKKGLQVMLSNFLRIRKEFGIGWMLFDLFIYLLAVPVYFIGGLLHNVFSGRNEYKMSAMNGFASNVFTVVSYLPKMIKNKSYFYKVL